MAEPKCEPTIWHEMTRPVEGGRKHYQEKSWNPFFKKGGGDEEEQQPEEK